MLVWNHEELISVFGNKNSSLFYRKVSKNIEECMFLVVSEECKYRKESAFLMYYDQVSDVGNV